MPFFFEKCKIELNGKTYLIDPSSKSTVETLDKVMKTGASFVNGENAGKTEEEKEQKVIDVIREATDQICGAGTFEDVFAGRVINVFDAIDMWSSICNDIALYKLNRIKQLSERAG